MVKLFIACLTVLTFNAHATEFESFKSTGSGLSVYTEAAIAQIWGGNVPACIKLRGKVLKRNAAYAKAFKDDKSYCSPSASSKRMAKELKGVNEVIIIKTAELPSESLKKVMSSI